ncbi:MAG TPA: helix-turn-helix domain-containing protein [Saprospiraceae bacterium]|nr:helix-turn-helix domain-containing protein [Saprospiraceae bacterium]HMP24354.1 helix-turn-helix domain-containing protein [Saprospiraceae bacterium]
MKLNAYIPSKLTGIVDLIWEHEMYVPGSYAILPSGKVEIIFPINPVKQIKAVKMSSADNPVNSFPCFLSGLHTRPLKMTFERFHTFGIQMKPVAVKALFGMPLCEIRDYYIEGTLVFDTINRLEDKLYTIDNFTDRAKWFENFLLSKIDETPDLHNAIHLDATIKNFILEKRHGSAKSVLDVMGYSRTQTYRLFNEWFGLSAHSYQKLLQFISATESLHNPALKLTDIAFENGFYDQSHFIRTFQEFAGMTPGEYRRQMTGLPGLLFG